MGALGGVDSRRKPMYFSRAKMRRVFDISIMVGITIPLMSLFDRPTPPIVYVLLRIPLCFIIAFLTGSIALRVWKD